MPFSDSTRTEWISEDEASFRYSPKPPRRDSTSEALSGATKAVATTSTYIASGHLSQFVLPGLFVTEAGHVALPVSTTDANRLIEYSKQLSNMDGNGGGNELTNKPWVIDADNVSFQNSSWDTWLASISKKVSHELGVPASAGTISAELDKMLICGKGDNCKEDRCTEDLSGAFGTLAIYLPSIHSGASEHLRYDKDNNYLFPPDSSSPCDMTYLAWYKSVDHEVEPLRSGHRIALIYTLKSETEVQIPFPAAKQRLQSQLNLKLEDWFSINLEKDLLCFAFDKTYATEGLKLAALKGVDHQRACYMLTACQETDQFFMFLARLDKTGTVDEADEDYEDQDEKYTLDLGPIVDLSGSKLADCQSILDENLVQELYHNRKEDERQGYEGEERVFTNTVMVIVRREKAVGLLLGQNYNEGHFRILLQYCLTRLERRKVGICYRDLVVMLCAHTYTTTRLWKEEQFDTRDSVFGAAFVAACYIDEHTIAENILAALRSVNGSFNYKTFAELAQLHCGNPSAAPQYLINAAFASIRTLSTFHMSLLSFCKNLRLQATGPGESLGDTGWREARISNFFEQSQHFHKNEAIILLDIVKRSDDSIYDNCFRSYVDRHLTNSVFVNCMLVVIFRHPPRGDDFTKSVLKLLSQLASIAISRLDLRYFVCIPDASHSTIYVQNARQQIKVLRDFHRFLLQHNIAVASDLLIKFKQECFKQQDVRVQWYSIMLFLEQMGHILESGSAAGTTFYRDMLSYLLYRGPCEQEVLMHHIPISLTREAFWLKEECYGGECLEPGMICEGCQELAIFLLDPLSTTHQFSIHTHDLDHLELQMRYINSCKMSFDWPYLDVRKVKSTGEGDSSRVGTKLGE